MVGGNSVEVCANSVIGKNSVSAKRSISAHNVEFYVTAGKNNVARALSGKGVLVGADKVVLTAACALKFGVIGKVIRNFVSLTISGVINAGEFGDRLIKSVEYKSDVVAYIGCIAATGNIFNSIGHFCSSHYLIYSLAVRSELENVVASDKSCCGKAAVCVLADVLPACALIGRKLNGGFCFVKSCVERESRRIGKGINSVVLGIPSIFCTDSIHGKPAAVAADIDNNKAGTLGIGCAVCSGIAGAAADFDGVIFDFEDNKTLGNAFDVHPVGLFANAGVTCAAVGRGRHFDMLSAGNYGVAEVRLDHNVPGIVVDNLPCAAVCAKSEGFANAEGKVILSVDIYHCAGFYARCKDGAGNIIFCAFRVLIFRKGYGDILVSV